MRVRRRSYEGASDLARILRFTQRIWSLRSRWHLGDLAWNLGPQPAGRPDRPMAMWELDGEIMACGWLTMRDRDGGGDLALLVDPAHPDLVGAVLAWAADVVPEPVTVTVLDTESMIVDELRRCGYTADPEGRFFLAHHRRLADLPATPPLPAGFTVRPVDGTAAERNHRAALHRAVWPGSTLTDERTAALTAGWPYRPEMDLVALAPDGRFVAYCLGWYDEHNRVGELEPVGTLPEFRRMGLSRAVGLAALRAFRAAGGELALVYARGDEAYPVPKQVYAALGFTPHARTVRFRPPRRPPGR